MKVNAKLTGTNKLLSKFDRFGKEGAVEVEQITEVTARVIEEDAKQNAPVNDKDLRQGIKSEKLRKLTYVVLAVESYSAFVEFGTGRHVDIPKGWEKMASKFKGKNKGSFKEGLESIKKWCRSKGINQKAAYPIFMSILKEGITPQPFLYPAFKKGQKQYATSLKRALAKLTNKYNKK